MEISILGATSSVGFNLIKLFQNRYPEVKLKLAGRNITKLEYLNKKFANVISVHKFSHGSDLNEILKDTEACIDLSYQISGVPSQLVRSSVKHADNLIYQSRTNEIKNLIIVGSVGIYGEPKINYKWQDAPLPNEVKPNSLYGQVKLSVEREAWKKAGNISTNLFLVRSGHIFGASTKMAGAFIQKLINNGPVLLEGRSVFSNATTLNGLCNSIINLCFNNTLKGRYCANHVDLSDIPYGTLVNKLADILDVEPSKLPVVDKKRSKSGLFSYLKKYQEDFFLLQSKIGLYDFGLSEFALNQIQPKFNSFKIYEQLAVNNNPILESIYNSDKIIHSKNICGDQLDLDHEFEQIKDWISFAGFKV